MRLSVGNKFREQTEDLSYCFTLFRSEGRSPGNAFVRIVSITLEQDGKKTDFYGPSPQGQLTYDPDGRFSVIITRSDLPKFASNNRRSGTPEENKAIVQGSFAYFGTYSVSETDKAITTHVESSTFPNWNGIQRKTSFNISGDELSTTSTVGAGAVHTVWKRAK